MVSIARGSGRLLPRRIADFTDRFSAGEMRFVAEPIKLEC